MSKIMYFIKLERLAEGCGESFHGSLSEAEKAAYILDSRFRGNDRRWTRE